MPRLEAVRRGAPDARIIVDANEGWSASVYADLAPHLVRLVTGPDNRYVLPASAICGAIMLTGADAVARIIVLPAELPIGLVTGIVGGPFFLGLLMREKKRRRL